MPQITIDLEIKAEVFKIIRANQDKTPRQILLLIRKHLPDVDLKTISECVEEFAQK
jgi:hypothetical protein